MTGIYDEPELYLLSCAYRDVPAEATALQSWFGEHGSIGRGLVKHERGADAGKSAGAGPEAGSVLELAAGPAEHARELASRGLRVTALDRSPAMCGYAAARAREAGLGLEVVEADMRDFSLPRRFDAAITMLNSLCHLLTLDDMVAHLRTVAAHLVPGGLYVIELSHPADHFGPTSKTTSEWVIESGGTRAEVRWGEGDSIDPLTQITDEHMSIIARDPDGTVRTAADVVPSRFWTFTEMTAATRLAGGLSLAATYGDFDSTALDAPDAWRMILILRRD
ncbi:MAG: class I SAM-dependent methyltransferase [Nocardiopsaceae bacterium]|nr:class I SAM-dependent methyltransferase [Nocardiopsaceae bacterium]